VVDRSGHPERRTVKKLLLVVAFMSSATFGAACKNDLKDACEVFVEIRDECEALTPPDPEDAPKYAIDMCANIDPECQAFYECAIFAPCNKDGKDRYRLDLDEHNKNLQEANGDAFIECEEPENKACTDADLRG